MTESERKLIAQIRAHESWARTPNRTERTSRGRRAFEQKFLDEAGGDPKRAESLRRAHFARMALKSAQARRKAREARAQADVLDRQADEADAALESGGVEK